MARYRKILVRIWNDAKFASMSDNGKLAFLYLLTCQYLTSLGAMRATIPGLAADMRWTEEAFREAFREGLAKGLLECDEEACYVGILNFLKHNPPESPNVVKSWDSQLELIPECDLKLQLVQRVKAFMEGMSEGFRKALPEAFRKGMPNPEPYPEPKPNTEEPPNPPAGGKASRKASEAGRASKFDPLAAELPAVLRTFDFRDKAWPEFCQHRREIGKPMTPTATTNLLRSLEAMGPEKAVIALRTSMQNGWTGVFTPDQRKANNGELTFQGLKDFVGAHPDEPI